MTAAERDLATRAAIFITSRVLYWNSRTGQKWGYSKDDRLL